MTMTKVRASALLAALTLAAVTQVHAQSAPPPSQLSIFVNNSVTATALQRNAGNAVQNMCNHLRDNEPSGGFNLQDPQKHDLFLRCNELVQTAQGINTGQQPGRSLGLDSNGLLGALQQVSGEELSSQGALTTRVSSGQFANISGRLNALRFGTTAAAARGRTASLYPSPSAPNDYGPDRVIDPSSFTNDSFGGNLMPVSFSTADTAPAAGDASTGGGGVSRQWGWFTEGSYNFGNHDQTTGEDGFDFDAASATIGGDYNFGSAVLGVSAGYDRYKADFDTNNLVSGGDLEVKGGSASVFGAWFGSHVTVDGIASYGSLSSDISRRLVIPSTNTCAAPNPCPVQDRTFTGSPDGDYFSMGVSAGYEFDAASWNLTTSVAANYRDVSIDSYGETDSVAGGGLALAYGEQKVESFRSIVGFSASRGFSKNFGIITPTFRAEWHHEFKDDPRTIQASYAVESSLINKTSPCVSCFALQSDTPESDFGIAGAGLSLTFAGRVQAYVYYEALLGVSDYKSNSIALGFRGQF
jgi:outer membrane lipase/esterase